MRREQDLTTRYGNGAEAKKDEEEEEKFVLWTDEIQKTLTGLKT